MVRGSRGQEDPCSQGAWLPHARAMCMAGYVASVKSLLLSELEISHGLKQSSKPSQDEKTMWETEASRQS